MCIILSLFLTNPHANRKINELRQEHAEYLSNRQQEALDAQTLMSDIADRKRKQEENKPDGMEY